ncbi:unnamed protein product [Gordionus sp. m RMFG-2023]
MDTSPKTRNSADSKKISSEKKIIPEIATEEQPLTSPKFKILDRTKNIDEDSSLKREAKFATNRGTRFRSRSFSQSSTESYSCK